jgi:HEAT repeat protein
MALSPNAAPAAPHLVDAISDDDEATAETTAAALAKIGRPARAVAKSLAALLVDKRPHVRKAAATALRGVDPDLLEKIAPAAPAPVSPNTVKKTK